MKNENPPYHHPQGDNLPSQQRADRKITDETEADGEMINNGRLRVNCLRAEQLLYVCSCKQIEDSDFIV